MDDPMVTLTKADKATLALADNEGETIDGCAVGRDPITGSWVVIGSERAVVVERHGSKATGDEGVTYSERAAAVALAKRGDANIKAVDEGTREP